MRPEGRHALRDSPSPRALGAEAGGSLHRANAHPVGQVLPAATDDCSTALDEDCTGAANEACACSPGMMMACYDGPAGTLGVGLCAAGSQSCDADGVGYGACMGQVTPTPQDDPMVAGDDDCDGLLSGAPYGSLSLGGAGSDSFYGVAVDPADGSRVLLGSTTVPFVVGADTVDGLFLVKYASDGAVVWTRSFGVDIDSTPTVPAIGPAGEVYFAGATIAAFDFGPGPVSGPYVVRLDSSGQVVWARSCGGTGGGAFYDLAIDPTTGTLAIAGYLAGTLGPACGSLSSPVINGVALRMALANGGLASATRIASAGNGTATRIAALNGGRVVITGTTPMAADIGGVVVSPGASHYLVALEPAGAIGATGWVKAFNTGVQVLDLAASADDEVFVSGYLQMPTDFGGGPLATDGSDAFLVGFQSDGTHLWSKSFGDGGVFQTVVSGGVLTLATSLGDLSDFGGGLLGGALGLVSLDAASGNHLWSRGYAGDLVFSAGIALMPDASFVVGGGFTGALALGKPLQASGQASDVFVTSVEP